MIYYHILINFEKKFIFGTHFTAHKFSSLTRDQTLASCIGSMES